MTVSCINSTIWLGANSTIPPISATVLQWSTIRANRVFALQFDAIYGLLSINIISGRALTDRVNCWPDGSAVRATACAGAKRHRTEIQACCQALFPKSRPDKCESLKLRGRVFIPGRRYACGRYRLDVRTARHD